MPVVQHSQEASSYSDSFQLLLQGFQEEQEGLYVSLDTVNKVAHPIKPSSELTYNKYFDKFNAFIDAKVSSSECFPLSLVVRYFNFLANKKFFIHFCIYVYTYIFCI